MNVPSTTTQLSTISTPAAPKAETEAPETAPPASAEPGTSPGAATSSPDPDLEVTKRLETISRREAKQRKSEAEHHARMSALSEKEKAIDAKLAELDDALGDPVKYMLDKGKNPVEVAERFAKPETPEEKRIRKLEEAAEARATKDKEDAERHETQQKERARMEVVREFVGGINEREHPHLIAEYPDPHDIPPLVTKLLNRRLNPRDPDSQTLLERFNEKHGRNPTDDEIRETLELESESRATRIIESRSRRANAQAPASQSSGTSPQQPPAKSASGTSGISNHHASITNSGKPRPRSLEEKRRENRKQLIEAFEAEATERQ